MIEARLDCNGECKTCPFSMKWSKDMQECYATFIVYPEMSLAIENAKNDNNSSTHDQRK